MNHQLYHQPMSRNLSHLAPQQCLRVPWQKRLCLIVLTFGNLLLVNTLFFAHIAHATATPPPPPPPRVIPKLASARFIVDLTSIPKLILPNTTFTLRGTAPSGSLVEVINDSSNRPYFFNHTTSDASGNWHMNVRVTVPGHYEFMLYSFDPGMNVLNRALSFGIDVVTVDAPDMPRPTPTGTPLPASTPTPTPTNTPKPS